MKYSVLVVLFAGFLVVSSKATAAAQQSVTFYRDVLPLLQENCQTCHRPGEVGPMPLLTYDQARPWAKAIREAVVSRKMPPWNVAAPAGRFRNDPSLSTDKI